ncbi:MAG: hypothetical protein ABI867_10040 [Kofleriaceae bacterium]
MASRRGKIIFGLGALVFGALTFQLAAAYLIERGQPTWLAAVAGCLAFPVLPLAWHIWGEHRRKAKIAAAKTPPKSSLAPGDRYVLRAIAVAIVVLAPMFAIGRFAVVRAAWDHRTWFIPEPESAYSEGGGHASQSALLSHVPSEAEAVIVFVDNAKTAQGKAGVLAYGAHQLLAIVPQDLSDHETADDKVAAINKERDKVPFLTIDPVVNAGSADGLMVIASERWKSQAAIASVGPSAALRGELDRAPAGNAVVAAYVPATPILGIKRAAAWVISNDDKKNLIVDARVETVDAKSAETLLASARASWNAKSSEVPAKCRDQIDAIASEVKIERTGAVFTFHVEIPGDKLMGIMMCGFKAD